MEEHVLVPIDGSEPAWKAIEFVANHHDGDRVSVIHVVDPVDHMYGGMEGGYYNQEIFDQAVEQGEELCDQALEQLQDAGSAASIETSVESGRPARTIIEYATEHEVDQIVMGSHGRSGVSRLLLGSVAEKVVRRATVPVTIVR